MSQVWLIDKHGPRWPEPGTMIELGDDAAAAVVAAGIGVSYPPSVEDVEDGDDG